MANWDSYTQKSTPEDNDTLMIKDTSASANKRTPFSGVWNWMVSKLTSAVISQLETTNKSIVPAINELNSKSIFKNTMASDLNELLSLDTGVYIHRFVGATAENIPEKASGFVITHVHDTDNASQWIFFLRGNRYRRYKGSGSVAEWTRDNA